MINDRVFFEINEDTCKIENNILIVIVPYEKQSMTGVDFYFNPEFVKDKELKIKSVSISPAPLACFWNWLTSVYGTPEYEVVLNSAIDISKYQISGDANNQIITGTFGFSGYAVNESDITIKFQLVAED